MNRLWLIFAQTVTVAVAVLFVVTTLKPGWLPTQPSVIALQEAQHVIEDDKRSLGSYREAARAAATVGSPARSPAASAATEAATSAPAAEPPLPEILPAAVPPTKNTRYWTTRFSATFLVSARKASRNATPGLVRALSSAPMATS